MEIYRKLRQVWQQHLKIGKEEKQTTAKTAVLRPKSERDCRFCLEDKGRRNETKRETPISWQLRKGKGGPKKKVNTAGYFCSNDSCEYYGLTEEAIHALVGYGSHGLYEEIQDFKCQACKSKFTIRRNTILYRLKSHSELVEKILWLQALGVEGSALEEVYGVREVTIGAGCSEAGYRGEVTRSSCSRTETGACAVG